VQQLAIMTIISKCTASLLKDAAKSLIAGNLVAFPTETVYGLGADASNQHAVARIYEVKGRPTDHPLIVHISSINNLDKWAQDIPEYAVKLARAFWPGPMTLILPRTDLAKDFITGGQNNVGIRVPAHTVALTLLNEFEAQGGYGIAAPSANRFGKVSPTNAQSVLQDLSIHLNPMDQIIDGGSSIVGIESTIINCTNGIPEILRPGYITRQMVEKVLGVSPKIPLQNSINRYPRTPGLYKSHYSPDAKILLSGEPGIGDGYIALNSISTPNGVIRLAAPKNVEQYAKILYESFRLADKMNIKRIFVVPPIGEGLSIAINDRIRKASNSQ
jgi:L-threonylcarbamoyladenylate synthase